MEGMITVKCENCGTEITVDAVVIDMGYYIAMCSKCDEFRVTQGISVIEKALKQLKK